MIVSASYRCDIPAHLGDWFAARLAAGWAEARNPVSGRPYRVSLAPGASDGFVFWTRNLARFGPVLEGLAAAGRPFVVQFTVTGYPRPIEPGVIDTETAVAQILATARRHGRGRLVWRYDPVLLSDLTPADWHQENFARLAARLAPAVDEVVLSFAQIYRKARRQLDHLRRAAGLQWRDPSDEEKRARLVALGGLARDAGLTPSLCSQPGLLEPPLVAARCIDAERLSRFAERPLAARAKGNRPGCLCAESRDIGAYDLCAQGCAYCYAVASRGLAKRRLRVHDPAAVSL